MIFLLEIDGSYGEGGGQILRTAVALSALKNVPIKIINIRANRPDPGIKAQHYVAIKCIKELCGAEVSGLEIGSSTLTFIPGDVKGGKYKFDIGTAGSIILVFQTCILAFLKSSEPINIKVTGGTDNKFAPTWDFFQHVFIPLIKKFGVKIDTKLIKRGYYPRGGGEAEITIHPTKNINPLKLADEQLFFDVKGLIHIANLPDHIATRIKHSSIKKLLKNNFKSDISIEQTSSFSPGTGITLWAESQDTILGTTVLGERGLSSEEVGNTAAGNIIKEIVSGANIDVHAFDQLLPYMTIFDKKDTSSCIVREISNHASTNIWVLKKFFDVDFEIKQNENNFSILIKNK